MFKFLWMINFYFLNKFDIFYQPFLFNSDRGFGNRKQGRKLTDFISIHDVNGFLNDSEIKIKGNCHEKL